MLPRARGRMPPASAFIFCLVSAGLPHTLNHRNQASDDEGPIEASHLEIDVRAEPVGSDIYHEELAAQSASAAAEAAHAAEVATKAAADAKKAAEHAAAAAAAASIPRDSSGNPRGTETGGVTMDGSSSAPDGSILNRALHHVAMSQPWWAPLSVFNQATPQLRSAHAHHHPTGAKQGFGDLGNGTANASHPVLYALGGGTGATIGGTGNLSMDRDLLRRMHYQDKAVIVLVLMVYLVALWFSANLTYRQASNNLPVTYYADPRFHTLVMEGHDLDAFLETFNQAPKNIRLQVTGFVAVPEEIDDDLSEGVHWQGENYQVAFTFSLDLSPWVERESHTVSAGPRQQARTLTDGCLPEDRSILHNFLTQDENDLGLVELVKEVTWPGWEELATNIKHQIRQNGFGGVITVNRVENEDLQVYKNKAWANFMHSRATRVLCALSVVGWLLYVPYMWIRCKKTTLRSYYKVDVGISEYWHLIADKLSAHGFNENGGVVPVTTEPTNA